MRREALAIAPRAASADPANVEQREVRLGLPQRVVLVLPVDVDQRVADRREHARRGQRAVQMDAVAAAPRQRAAHQQLVPSRFEAGVRQSRARRLAGPVEERLDLGLLLAVRDRPPPRPAPDERAERAHEDRLAGAGLAGDHVQPGLEARSPDRR